MVLYLVPPNLVCVPLPPPQPPPYHVTTSLSKYKKNLPREIEWGIASTVDVLARPYNKVLFPKGEGLTCLYGCIEEKERKKNKMKPSYLFLEWSHRIFRVANKWGVARF